MEPPKQFFEDLEALRTHFKWATLSLDRSDDDDVEQGKMTLSDFREFDAKWGDLVDDPEFKQAMVAIRGFMERLEIKLKELCLRHLLKVIKARLDWLEAEALFGLAVRICMVWRGIPEDRRPDFENIFHYTDPEKAFDGEQQFRAYEARANQTEADFRLELTKFGASWPERLDALLRERLEKLEGKQAGEWVKEINEEVAELTKALQA